MMRHSRPYVLFTLLCLAVTGCSTTTVRTTEHEEIVEQSVPIPEDQLLDVGIGIFDPGVEEISEDQPGIYPKIRAAEARYIPYRLMETLQHSGNWGIVRVIPGRQSEMDLWIDGEILKSDGASLELKIAVQDSSGKTWFTKRYTAEASKYSYDPSISNRAEPFQGLYNSIANDMLQYHGQHSPGELKALRTITELNFAKQFSPDAFSGYLETDKKGYLHITRLPPGNDPVLLRIRQIRERDYMFVDTLQEYYASFVRKMDEPYLEWRRAFYEESLALREVQSQATGRMLGGALAVLAGILAQGSDSRVTRTAGAVGIGAGAGIFMSGLHKREEAKVHTEALQEISASLDAEMEPHTLTLEDRTVTLTGSVNDQYGQWRQILKDIYNTDTGQTGPVAN